MEIDGQCHCGRIQYKAEIDPDSVVICHCTDCQALTGSPYRVTALARGAIQLTAGEPKIYAKTGDNGLRRFQHFCGDCGASLFTGGEGVDAGEWGIRWGSIRQRREISPKRQIWRRYALPWIGAISGLPGRQTD